MGQRKPIGVSDVGHMKLIKSGQTIGEQNLINDPKLWHWKAMLSRQRGDIVGMINNG
jgi:hypothetical protein